MGQHELFAFYIILMCGVSSLPWPKGETQDQANSTIAPTTMPKSVKFPSSARTPAVGMMSKVHQYQRPMVFSNGSRASQGVLSSDEGGIVFPNDKIMEKIPKFVPGKQSPDCDEDSTFCENADDYPSAYVEGVLQNTATEFRSMFGKDFVDDDSIVHRIDTTEDNPLCASVEQVVYPKKAKNKNDDWLYVINQGEYKQGVRIETCLNKSGSSAGQKCQFDIANPLGYRTYCKQKYIYRKLLALSPGGEPVSDTFPLPSCCACTVRREGLNSRVGAPGLRSSLRTTPAPATSA